MIGFLALAIMIVLGVVAFIVGYFRASSLFDGRKENMPKSFKLLTGLKYADRVIILSIIAQIIVYITRN